MISQLRRIAMMKAIGRHREVLRLAANLVECGKAVVDVERGVLHALRHHRAAALLKLHHESHVLLAPRVIDVLGELLQEDLTEKVEDRSLSAGFPPKSLAHRAPDGGTIFCRRFL